MACGEERVREKEAVSNTLALLLLSFIIKPKKSKSIINAQLTIFLFEVVLD